MAARKTNQVEFRLIRL
ncbi:hypothetical protein FOXB_16426 [Fusarium oxysporum f. sp. conglutinans Fo5176]|uniref:Uncharacterized protein n=1 Tax=Fusarium oxysporum (strain Fo5176) TaxID=660025 RepID=F9GCP3_FUSOF|nr:hypothetical protein FOXB_16426 [Fusarium oxysporum f. sp. conglutinans Fo5176]